MRYKTLITGTLKSAIEDIFVHLDTSMRCFTCSVRYKDIERHIKELEPDLFILCLKSENREVINYMTKVKQVCEKYGTVFVILGDAEVCSDFNKMTINVSDITLEKPLTESMIIHKINEYFARKAEEERKELERQEQLRIEKEKREREKLENELVEVADEKKHILVIDDDVNVLKMIKELIGDKYNVGTAISGNIAMKFLERKHTNLILLDYEMPGENGPQVLERLRAGEKTKDIPVVFLTGVSEREKIQEVLVLKPQGYLLKPVDHKKLESVITGLIG